MKTFPEWLENELGKKSWTRADLAREAGISQSTLSLIYSGNRQPGKEVCSAVAQALRLPPETVFVAAGMLPAKSVSDERVSRFETLLKDLSDDDVDDLYALALSKLERKSQRKLKPAT